MATKDFPALKLTLSALSGHIEKFLESYRDKSRETRGTYQRALREFEKFFALDKKFHFRVRDVERYKNYLAETRKLQQISVATYMTALRRFCQYMSEAGILPGNPASGVQGGTRPSAHNRTFLSLDEVQQLFDSIGDGSETGLRDRALIHMMLSLACSELEIARADVGDLKKSGGKDLLYVQGKGKQIKDETLEVPPRAYEAIRAYLLRRVEKKGGQGLSPDEPLFLSNSNRTQNQRISIRGIREAVGARLRNSGVKKGRDLKLTPFSLRHTAGILLAESGVPVEELMKRMRIEWRPTAMLYYRQKGKLSSEGRTEPGELRGIYKEKISEAQADTDMQ